MDRPHCPILLPNGLRLVVLPRPHLQGVALSALVRCGSGDERPSQEGLAHLLEHMVFRGARRHRTAEALMAPFEDGGGMLEAETWRDHTHFSALLHKAHLGPALRALGDMLTAPRLVGLPAERRLVEAEIEGELDEQGEEATLHTLSRRAVWGEHPMARRITGSVAGVRRHDRAALSAFHAEHYVGRRTVLVLAGAIEPVEAVALASSAFGAMPAGTPAAPSPTARFAPRSALSWVPASGPQLSVQLSFDARPVHSAQHPAEELLGMILCDGMLSRLQGALSEQSGLVYSFDAGFDLYRDFGTYDLEMQVAPARAAAALGRAIDTFAALAAHGPTAVELRRAKQRAVLSRCLDRDRPAEAAYAAGVAVLFEEPADDAAAYAAVEAADVRRAARQLFFERGRHLLVAGPARRPVREALTRRLEQWPALGHHGVSTGARHAAGRAAAARRPPLPVG